MVALRHVGARGLPNAVLNEFSGLTGTEPLPGPPER